MVANMLALAFVATLVVAQPSPKVSTVDGKIKVEGQDVVFATEDGNITATNIQGLESRVNSRMDTANSTIVAQGSVISAQGAMIETQSSMIADLHTALSSSESSLASTLATLGATLFAADSAAMSRINSLDDQLSSTRSTVSVQRAQLSAASTGISSLTTRVGTQTSLASRMSSMVVSQQTFTIPMKNDWSQSTSNGLGSSCSTAEHGQLRRINGTAMNRKATIVYCNGNRWQRIAPMIGRYSDDRLPGGGCVMRDIFSFRTTSSGCRYIQMKTNIRVRTNTMYNLELKGYNYGTGRHIDSATVGYTYQHWSCAGQQSNNNYGNAGAISVYCSRDGYIVVQYYAYSSAYYLGMHMTASFLNPTGEAMCGKFEVVANRCNSRY